MYELVQVSEHCYYIQCPAKIGLVRTGRDQVCLIDSGNDLSAGKKVKKILDEKDGPCRQYTTPTPMRTISAATSTCRSRRAAGCMPLA